MIWNKQPPRWAGTIAEPSETKKDDGFLVGDRPPAYWENWFRKANYEAHEETRDNIDLLNLNKVDKVEGKDLSTNDFTTLEKQKLAGIQEGATNYQHPLSHSLDMITETTAKKIMTSTERTKLAGIASGAQVNTVTSVAGKAGAVSLTKADVGLNLVDNLSAASIRTGTTKADVGLGSVLNYGVATTAEAQVGTSNSKYMTPLRVKESISSNVKIAHGTYTGNDIQGRNITVGFTPKKVWIVSSYRHYFIGEQLWIYISSGGYYYGENLITANGFSIVSTDANEQLNLSSLTYDWTAIG